MSSPGVPLRQDPDRIRRGPYKHVLLALSTAGAVGSSVIHMGTAYLLPALINEGLPLAAAGAVVAMPAAGIVLTLIAWGWFVDRFGERAAMSIGLLVTSIATFFAAAMSSVGPVALSLALLLAGCGAASVNSASGRVVSGWYPADKRGLAMGLRQMAQPLGAAVGAMSMPLLAHHYSVGTALAFSGSLCLALSALCFIGIINPPRPAKGSADQIAASVSPYHRTGPGIPYLVRVHIASAMQAWPQSMVGAYLLVWLLSRGFSPGNSSVIVLISQLFGATSRALLGHISDRVGSRIRPYRWVATTTLSLAAVLAVTDFLMEGFGPGMNDGTAASGGALLPVATVLFVMLAVSAVSPNGLAFTAVAEYSGPFWSGRALGTQNTFQNIIYAATPPVAGLIVSTAGFPVMFAVTAALPAISLVVAPRGDERREAVFD
ncbi:MFS transporter [Corynebacterium sputi]|uniref:MFS transporter n=1 Tax=Corynebacterium sputi TaxID=489915 RepID=UPI001F0A9ABB|nr:MFS transporter [Corynebacterium sputi]